MATVEAKGKVKERHRMAIEKFNEWEREHPNATKAERVKHFDLLVDTSELARRLKK